MNATFVPFPPGREERNVVREQTSGEGCSNGRPMTLTESGRFRFSGCSRLLRRAAAVPFGSRALCFRRGFFRLHHFPFSVGKLAAESRELTCPLQPFAAIHGHHVSVYIA